MKSLASVSGDVDLATNDGRLIARIMGAVAKKSSDDTSRRIQRKKLELAERGRPAGRGHAFGYEPDGVTIRKTEAKVLRAAAKAVLAGESLTGIAREWNDKDVERPQGGKHWTATQIRVVLTNPRQAGLRVHRGEVIGPADWQPIIDRAVHERLVALLKDPKRRRRTPSRRSLLTGLVYCAACGTTMSRDLNNGRPVLRCRRGVGLAGCGRVSIGADAVEDLVSESVLIALDGPALADALAHRTPAADDDLGAEMSALEARQADLGEMFATGEVSRVEFLRMRRSIEDKLEDVRKQLGKHRGTDALEGLPTGPKLRKEWPELSVDRRREIIGTVLDRIKVAPALAGGPPHRRGRGVCHHARLDRGGPGRGRGAASALALT